MKLQRILITLLTLIAMVTGEVRLDTLWTSTFGGEDAGSEYLYNGIEASDGGYVVVGEKEYQNSSQIDALVIKLSQNGELEWSKVIPTLDTATYLVTNSMTAYSVAETPEGNFLVGMGIKKAMVGLYELSADGDSLSSILIETRHNKDISSQSFYTVVVNDMWYSDTSDYIYCSVGEPFVLQGTHTEDYAGIIQYNTTQAMLFCLLPKSNLPGILYSHYQQTFWQFPDSTKDRLPFQP